MNMMMMMVSLISDLEDNPIMMIISLLFTILVVVQINGKSSVAENTRPIIGNLFK
jgi:uncharacterized membrane protein YgaE (UPF0421/DUF939 family)